jgi:glutaredoxin
MATSRRSMFGLVVLVLAVSAVSQWWAGRHERQLGEKVALLAQPGDIRMLASETCSICMAARAWFTMHKVPFSECTIERDAACRADFEASGSPGTPVLVVRGRRLVGFSPDRLHDSLQSPRG